MSDLKIQHRPMLQLGDDVGHLHAVVARADIDRDDLRSLQDTIQYLWHAVINPHVIVGALTEENNDG